MKIIQLLAFVMTGSWLCSCGASREVRYVYVNPPQQQIQTSVNHDYSVQSSSTSGYTSSYTPPVNNSHSREKNCWDLSQEEIPGKVRGYGRGRSTDFSTANALAKATAKQDLIENFRNVVNLILTMNTNSTAEQTIIKAKRDFEQKFTGILPRHKVVCSKAQEGSINEIEICIEVNLKDIVAALEPILRGYAPQDKEAIRERLTKE